MRFVRPFALFIINLGDYSVRWTKVVRTNSVNHPDKSVFIRASRRTYIFGMKNVGGVRTAARKDRPALRVYMTRARGS